MQWWQRLWGRVASSAQPGSSASGAPAAQPVTSAVPSKRRWTFMVYMAGDNGKVFDTERGQMALMAEMTSAGYRDLIELGEVGSTPNVALVCLFDTQDDTYLVEVRKGKGFRDSQVRQLEEMNTGDPATLQWFITHSVESYPAEHYALVVWNHGTGWVDVDGYALVRALDDEPSHPPIFRTTPAKLAGGDTTRPIAFDDSSKDFLDSHDLCQALSGARAATGVQLDLIGMDACLMAMIEGARELAPHASYFVASQEVEPMAGWPYKPVAQAMDRPAAITPSGLAELIVQAYAESYGGMTRGQTVTQSAVVLARTEQTEALCKTLVESVLAADNRSLRQLVRDARDRAQVFEDRNFRDLGDFASQLAKLTEWESYPQVTEAAKALAEHLNARGEDAPVLKVGYVPEYERATGMSVYLPIARNRYAPDAYRHLAFVQATRWDKLLDWLLED